MKSCGCRSSSCGQKRARGTLTFAQNSLGQLLVVLDGRMRLFVALFCHLRSRGGECAHSSDLDIALSSCFSPASMLIYCLVLQVDLHVVGG